MILLSFSCLVLSILYTALNAKIGACMILAAEDKAKKRRESGRTSYEGVYLSDLIQHLHKPADVVHESADSALQLACSKVHISRCVFALCAEVEAVTYTISGTI